MVWLVVLLYVVGLIGTFGFASERQIVPALICAAIFVGPSVFRLRRALAARPSAMVCPNCGSENVIISNRFEGTTSSTDVTFKRSFTFPRHRAKLQSQSSSKVNRQRVARCQQCGFDYRYITVGEVEQEKKSAIISTAVVGVLILLALFWGFNTKPSERTNQAENTAAVSAEVNSVWAAEPTALADFKYYIDGDEITLTDYRGRDEKINIAPFYELDGKMYSVVSLDGTFALDSVTSVIIPEGVISIANNTFNSCGVKYIYFPSTLEKFNGWNYFHDAQKFYYGGSEAQWAEVCTRDRSSIDVVQIIYDANIADLNP